MLHNPLDTQNAFVHHGSRRYTTSAIIWSFFVPGYVDLPNQGFTDQGENLIGFSISYPFTRANVTFQVEIWSPQKYVFPPLVNPVNSRVYWFPVDVWVYSGEYYRVMGTGLALTEFIDIRFVYERYNP